MPDPITPPAEGTPPVAPAAEGTPAAPQDGKTVSLSADEYANLKKASDEFKEYKVKVDPVLETLWSDQELLNKATEAHNRRLGKTPTTPKTPETPTTPAAPVRDPDMRNSQINLINESFEQKVGINKLSPEKQKEVRGLVGLMMKEMLDPNNNKNITQVFEEVSLQKLPWYLDQAYKLINRDNDINFAKEQGKNEVLSQYTDDAGVMGSMPSGSLSADSVTLTPSEKKAAANMGVSEEDYLKNKKEILSLKN